ncbi:hypothetical protein DL1_09100 [Thioclava dalianensis]|uniref:Glycosyltransferase subfamily 4-like N-terminal domain-containing protein n=1 Tax=Thioclava dalianensis TaxID=1185766 RepID=A0A074U271_9RHOB|nr:glycosyltransferase family 4 protein [Thioclava dalianensis]KEP68732.1 hypothetical protein DL1_09100 [Thioclava dalianensis]SFN59213.1 Glycosyltransferase Family 4 [Thioclava dalianensis]
MTCPRIAFVLQDMLGWRSYRTRLERVITTRHDLTPLIIPVEGSRRMSLFHKRNTMRGTDPMFRIVDPIEAYEGVRGDAIRATLARFRPHAVHFAGHWPAGALAGLAEPPPFTVTLDATRAAVNRDLPGGRWAPQEIVREAALVRAAAQLYPMSAWVAKSLRRDCGVAPGAITCIPPSVDLTRIGARPERRAEGPLRVLFVGNDLRRKGAPRLIDWVRGPLRGQIALEIVSGDPAAFRYRDVARVHGAVANDTLLGQVMPQVDVLCLPTLSDMSPQVIVEAHAAGLAVVASDVGGIAGLVSQGETGWVIPPGDDAGFVAALQRLARDPALCAAMGQAAQARARAQFDATRNFDRMLDHLVDLAGRRQEECA